MMKLNTEKRLELLLDKGSLVRICEDIVSNFVVGRATIDGRPVVLLAVDIDSEVKPRFFDLVLVQNKAIEEALLLKCPLLLLFDVKEHLGSANTKPPIIPDMGRIMVGPYGMGHVYNLMGTLAGKVPRICMSFGYMAGTMSFYAGLSDAVVMRDCGGACIGRPEAAKKMIGEDVDFATLGGAEMHASVTGMTDAWFTSDEEVIRWGKQVLSYLPTNSESKPPIKQIAPPPRLSGGDNGVVVPDNPDCAFDIRLVIDCVIDEGSLIEMKEHYAKGVITGFARIEGRSVGIVANQSIERGGILFPETCRKINAFIKFCDRFHIPICFLLDTPGYMVGTAAERGGIISAATELYTTLANAKCRRMSVVVRRAHSAGLYAMGGPGFDSTSFIALPTAKLSVYGPKAIERFVEDKSLSDKERIYAKEMFDYATNPDLFVEQYMLDEVVELSELRSRCVAFVNNGLPIE